MIQDPEKLAQSLLAQARAAIDAEDYQDAIELCNRANKLKDKLRNNKLIKYIRKLRQDAELNLHVKQAIEDLRIGGYEDSIKHCDAALKLVPHDDQLKNLISNTRWNAIYQLQTKKAAEALRENDYR